MPAYGLDGPWRDRPGLRADDGAGGRARVDHRPAGRPAPHPAGPVRSQRRGARRVRRAGRARAAGADRRGQPRRGGDVRHRHRDRGRAGHRVVRLRPPGRAGRQPVPVGRAAGRVPDRRPGAAGGAVGDDDEEWRALDRRPSAVPTWPGTSASSTLDGRRAHHDEIDAAIAEHLAAARPRRGGRRPPARRACRRPRCNDPRLMGAHPHLRARGYFEEIDHPVAGVLPTPVLPFRVDGVDRWGRSPAPLFGQHNRRDPRTACSACPTTRSLGSRRTA